MIARTGAMAYGAGETPVRTNDQGFALIHRDAAEVFSPASMYSMTGKPVTDDHPTTDVTPANWATLAKGHVMTPHRGTADRADWLMADVVIADPGLIRKVQDGKVELSCGYIANYVEDAVGRGRQTNIRHNHLAVVDRGRCGRTCRIGDAEYKVGEKLTLDAENEYVVGAMSNHSPGPQATEDAGMSVRNKALRSTGIDRVRSKMPLQARAAFDAAMKHVRDADMMDDPDADNEGDGNKADLSGHTINNHIHLPAEKTDDGDDEDEEDDKDKRRKTEDRIVKRVLDGLRAAGIRVGDVGEGPNPGGAEDDPADENKKLKGDIDMEAPPGTNQNLSTSDKLSAIVRDNAALANAMAPGIQVPTYDRAASSTDEGARRCLDSLCAMRRAALKVALNRPETISLASSLVRDAATVDRSTCAEVRTAFRAVGEVARAKVAATTHDSVGGPFQRHDTRAGVPAKGRVRSIAELNAANRKTYGGQA